ncbi:unnamed protein product, partial [marine sediment metagenome]
IAAIASGIIVFVEAVFKIIGLDIAKWGWAPIGTLIAILLGI